MSEPAASARKGDFAAPTLPLIPGIASGSQPLYFRQCFAEGVSTILHICHHDREMEALARSAPFFLKGVEILTFPAWDCLPYDRVSPHTTITSERISTLTHIATRREGTPLLVITTASALMQRIAPRSLMRQASFPVETGERLQQDALFSYLTHHGYRRAGKVMEPGEFAVRGNIVDIYPSGGEQAFRIDLFGDDVESIRPFDTMSQRSEAAVKSFTLEPASELFLNDETITRFREEYRELFGAAHRNDALYAAVSAGQHYPGMEHWLPLFYPELETLFDYLPAATITLDYQLHKTAEERHDTILDYYDARKSIAEQKRDDALYHPLKPEMLYISLAGLDLLLERRQANEMSPFAPAEPTNFTARAQANIHALSRQHNRSPIEELLAHAAEQQPLRHTVICCQSEGSRVRIEKFLAANNASAGQAERWEDIFRQPPTIWTTLLPLETGFSTSNISFYSEQDLFGDKLIRTRKKKKPSEAFLQEAAAFEVGELLVHREHGIARFEGLITLDVNDKKHDCLKLVYKDDDRLFLPVENIELLSRYGSDDEHTELDKLGAGSWQSRKARMKEKIQMAAEELMKIAAARAIKIAPSLSPPDGAYSEFCAQFPYNETEDQEKAIDDTLADLNAGKPMDRLICGDVGFGKTEVAIRAAFAAASDLNDKVQVALIAPTTLLVRQHYKNFLKRFDGTGLNVAMLSRLTTAKDAKAIKEGMKEGTVDIVLGTHSLLADSITFQNLGLVIVDEEQHFGVKQKEKLKNLKSNVHVLTLSATPIPRTLQLALSGVRDLSLITTPPVDRLAVRTFVMPYDPVVLREAVQREMHRGGQVFYVTPRISDIGELKQRIHDLVPEARMAVAHGQMAATELDSIMNGFYDGKYDVLLSTAIIESGLDIPTANTIIINRADRFGLAQLYQLRGRVGRGKIRAYAYYTLSPHQMLADTAVKRLEVMQTLDTLGAGFSLASHDMDIRGFGNLVGEEQSGHIREVGVELYQQMLEDAIAALKATPEEKEEAATHDWSPQINLGLSILIPEHYIEDLSLRLSLYRRLSLLQTQDDIDNFAAELTDRFGTYPVEVEHLLSVMALKRLCKQAGIERIDTGPKGAVLTLRENIFAKPEALIGFISRNAATMKIRPDQKIFCQQEYGTDIQRISKISELLNQIHNLL